MHVIRCFFFTWRAKYHLVTRPECIQGGQGEGYHLGVYKYLLTNPLVPECEASIPPVQLLIPKLTIICIHLLWLFEVV